MTTKTAPIYDDVNALLKNVTQSLSKDVAVRATRKLWDHFLGGEVPMIDVTSGNRYTWMRDGVLWVNPDQGWGRLVHDLSHYFHRTLYRRSFREHYADGRYDESAARPHSPQHAKLERRMAEYVLRKGWIDGALEQKTKPAEPAPDQQYTAADEKRARMESKLDGVLKRIDRWERKAKRARKALSKLNRARGYYERALGKGKS